MTMFSLADAARFAALWRRSLWITVLVAAPLIALF